MKVIAGVVLLIAIICAIFGALPRRAVAEMSWPNQLLWHDDEAFVFIEHGQVGVNTSYAYYWLSKMSAFGGAAQDSKRSTTVFRITSGTIEEHHLDGPPPFWLIAADGYVSNYVARWVGGRFEPYVPRKLPEAFKNARPQEFSDVEGWSKRTFMTVYGQNAVVFRLQGGAARLITSGDYERETIDLERTGMPTTRLMTLDRRSRPVSLAEYNEIFRK